MVVPCFDDETEKLLRGVDEVLDARFGVFRVAFELDEFDASFPILIFREFVVPAQRVVGILAFGHRG